MILFLLLAAHFLADFTLQPACLAKRKTESFKFLMLHSMIYAALIAVIGFTTVQTRVMMLPFVIIVLSHFVIDLIRIKLDAKFNSAGVRFWSFVFDQIVHTVMITVVFLVFNLSDNKLEWAKHFFEIELVRKAVTCGLMFVVVWDPASVFVKKLFVYLSNSVENYDTNEPKTGSLIGKLERLIIIVLVIFDAIGAIGFVLTAKSIARFKQFEEQGFAEKYLVGTLASTAIAIIVSMILKAFM